MLLVLVKDSTIVEIIFSFDLTEKGLLVDRIFSFQFHWILVILFECKFWGGISKNAPKINCVLKLENVIHLHDVVTLTKLLCTHGEIFFFIGK